jgi:hypothetical protein
MPGQEQLQTHANGLHRPRVATERTPAESGTRSGERPMGSHPVTRRRTVRVVPTRPDETTNRSAWIYVRHALMHPWHVVVLAGATVFGVANWSLFALLLVFAGAELLLLGIVLHLRVFRRYVDERLDQIERAKAAEQRATLLLQMGDEHRRELLRLESIVDKIRDATKPHGTAAQIAVDQCLRLLANYVRLAMTYHASRECLASVDRRALDDDARALEGARFSRSEQTRALAQRRLAIARRRAERWDQSREALDAITHQLAMIGELVQLTHEQVAAPADSGETTDEIDRIVQELDDNQSTIDELAEFLGTEDAIEPRMLEMGRAARV